MRELSDPDVKHGWIKEKGKSLFVTNPNWESRNFKEVEKLAKALVADVKKFSPRPIKVHTLPMKVGHLLVIDPADVHIGKIASSFETGVQYNCQIAIQRVFEGIDGILGSVNGIHISEIMLVIGNDILHVDGPKNETTSGTKQDTDSMWYDNFLKAKRLYCDIIRKFRAIAPVRVVYNPSNHDYVLGFCLSQVVEAYFSKQKDITFDISMSHRKGYRFFNNLIGTTHGDGAKQNDLPLMLANEFAKDWAETKHRYIYGHHMHHKIAKDYPGVAFEALRSPSEADSWHHRNGYQHCPKAIEGFVHHPKHGQIMRLTHNF